MVIVNGADTDTNVSCLAGTESATESADRRHNKNAEGNKDDDKVSLTLRFMPQQQRQRQRQHVSVKIQIHSLENADRGRPTVHCVHTRPTINYDDATLRTFEQVPKTLLGRPRCTLLQDTVYLCIFQVDCASCFDFPPVHAKCQRTCSLCALHDSRIGSIHRSMVATATTVGIAACTCSYAGYAARTSHPAHPSDALFACENCCRDVAVNNLQAPASNERLTATPSLRMKLRLRMRLRLRGLSTDGGAADHFTVRRWRRFKCCLVVVFLLFFFLGIIFHIGANALDRSSSSGDFNYTRKVP